MIFYDELKELLQFSSSLKDAFDKRAANVKILKQLGSDLDYHRQNCATLESGRPSTSSSSFTARLSKTFKDLTDGDSEASRHVSLVKSKEIIPRLEDSITELKKGMDAFDESFQKELAYYDQVRIHDWKKVLRSYAENEIAFFEKVLPVVPS